jgi:hypothetical protein
MHTCPKSGLMHTCAERKNENESKTERKNEKKSKPIFFFIGNLLEKSTFSPCDFRALTTKLSWNGTRSWLGRIFFQPGASGFLRSSSDNWYSADPEYRNEFACHSPDLGRLSSPCCSNQPGVSSDTQEQISPGSGSPAASSLEPCRKRPGSLLFPWFWFWTLLVLATHK